VTGAVQPMKSEKITVSEPIREPAEDDMGIDDRSDQVLSDHTDSPLIQSADNTGATSQLQEDTHANQPVVSSVNDLKVMVKDELPSENVLTAGIQTLTRSSNRRRYLVLIFLRADY